MALYNVTVEEVVRLYVTVEAEDEDEAKKLAVDAIIHEGEAAAYDTQFEERTALWAIKSRA